MAGTPTRSQVTGWHPDRLTGIGNGLQAPMDSISTNGTSMANTVRNLDWSGDGRAAAIGHADAETAAFNRLTASIESLKTALVNGAAAMAPNRDNLVNSADALEGNSFTVSGDWEVTDDVNYEFARSLAGDDEAALAEIEAIRQERNNHAVNETIRLTELARQLGVDAENCGNAITAAKGQIDGFAPLIAGLTIQNSQSDAQALQDGTLTEAQLARINAAADLTPEQLAALKSGQPANISNGQFDYIKSLMDGLDVASVEDLERLGAELPADQQEALKGSLADSMRLIAAPNFVRAEGGQRGGVDLLPADARRVLTSPPISEGPGGKYLNANATGLSSLARFMEHGDPNAKDVGSDINRQFLKHAAQIAEVDNDGRILGEPDRVASGLLAAAAQDHPAVADALGDGPGAAGAMNAADGDPSGDWNRDHMVAALMSADWEGHDAGLKSVIDGINDNATSESIRMATMSGESAEGVATYLADHPFGLNETLTNSASTLLGKYIPQMAGVNDAYLETRGFDPLDAAEFRNLFAAMDQYESSAVPFNDAAYASVAQLHGLGAANPDDLFKFASAAGRIDGAAQDGMDHYVQHGLGEEAQRAAQKTAVFHSLGNISSFAVKQIPVVGDFAGVAMDAGIPVAAYELYGSAPSAVDPTADITDRGGVVWQYYQLLQGSNTLPGFDLTDPELQPYTTTEHLEGKDLGVRLMTYEEILASGEDPYIAKDDFGQAMEHYMEKKGYDLGELNRGWQAGRDGR